MYGRDIVAPPGNQVATANTNFCLQHWESPVYSTKTHPHLDINILPAIVRVTMALYFATNEA